MLTAYPMQRMTLPQNERLVQVIRAADRVWSVKHLDGSDLLMEYRCHNQRDVMIVIDRFGGIPSLALSGE